MIRAFIIAGAVVAIVAIDLLVTVAIIRVLLKAGWSALVRKYPEVEPAPDAVRKNYQSFKIGAVRLGKCVHVAVDETHLHLTPGKVLRWLGARPVSIPWETIRITGEAMGGRLLRTRIDSVNVIGPAWCLDLAARAPQGDGPDGGPDTPADPSGDEGLFEEVDRATD